MEFFYFLLFDETKPFLVFTYWKKILLFTILLEHPLIYYFIILVFLYIFIYLNNNDKKIYLLWKINNGYRGNKKKKLVCSNNTPTTISTKDILVPLFNQLTVDSLDLFFSFNSWMVTRIHYLKISTFITAPKNSTWRTRQALPQNMVSLFSSFLYEIWVDINIFTDIFKHCY